MLDKKKHKKYSIHAIARKYYSAINKHPIIYRQIKILHTAQIVKSNKTMFVRYYKYVIQAKIINNNLNIFFMIIDKILLDKRTL